ncbi:sensor histidine kinase [Streptomyces sp. NPDC057445]|uniref:sensor histidine kinase n=1 Tax=Streptomyces sp. NPDC057445 TaxID=3346136 RepID=UPI0036CF875E
MIRILSPHPKPRASTNSCPVDAAAVDGDDAALTSMEYALLGAPGSRYSDDAGVRAHERRNALHTLVGLRELARQAEARPAPLEASPGTPLAEVAEVVARVDEPLIRAQLVGKILAAEERGVCLRLGPQSSLRGRVDRAGELVTVLGNLIDNAMDAVLGHDRAEPWIEVALHEDSEVTELRVTDNGPGVAPHLRRWVLCDGSSTKRRTDARHRGLGLALVRDIVGRRAGTTTVTDREGGGAVFTVRIPGRPRTSRQ